MGDSVRPLSSTVSASLYKGIVLQFTTQSGTQSPQALWPAVGRQERLWGIPTLKKFQFPRVCTGNQPLAKEPEDSGHDIVYDYAREADLTKGY